LLLATLVGSVWAGSVAYTYDTLGRLTKAAYATGVVVTYAYDAAGNRASSVASGASAPAAAGNAPVPALPATRAAAPAATALAPASSLEELPAGPVLLPTTGEDPAVYGWNAGSDQPQYAVEAVFVGDGADRLLHLQGYAIDAPDTVGLWLNGTLLGYLSPAAEDAGGTPSLWLLPASLQVPGENIVALVPRTQGLAWGVSRLGLYAVGSAWGN
jgi:YD repeat-containing protein